MVCVEYNLVIDVYLVEICVSSQLMVIITFGHINQLSIYFLPQENHIDVKVSVLTSSVVDHGFESRSGQTKDYEIGICCFSAKHTALQRKGKDQLAQNQDNASEWGDMSICGLFFLSVSQHYTNPTKRVALVKSGPHHHLIEH